MVKSGSLILVGLRPADAPLSAEGKQFLLTAAPAISYVYLYRVRFQCAILCSYSVSTEDIKTNNMCLRKKLQ